MTPSAALATCTHRVWPSWRCAAVQIPFNALLNEQPLLEAPCILIKHSISSDRQREPSSVHIPNISWSQSRSVSLQTGSTLASLLSAYMLLFLLVLQIMKHLQGNLNKFNCTQRSNLDTFCELYLCWTVCTPAHPMLMLNNMPFLQLMAVNYCLWLTINPPSNICESFSATLFHLFIKQTTALMLPTGTSLHFPVVWLHNCNNLEKSSQREWNGQSLCLVAAVWLTEWWVVLGVC